jgi:hypothetical protein
MPKRLKVKKAGRPPLPKGHAKAEMLRVRVPAEELKIIETGAKARNQTVSERIRNMMNQWVDAYCPTCEEDVMATVGMNRSDLITALEKNGEVLLVHAFPLAADHKFRAKKEQIDIIRRRIANGTL